MKAFSLSGAKASAKPFWSDKYNYGSEYFQVVRLKKLLSVRMLLNLCPCCRTCFPQSKVHADEIDIGVSYCTSVLLGRFISSIYSSNNYF